jgi:hypothetical protein
MCCGRGGRKPEEPNISYTSRKETEIPVLNVTPPVAPDQPPWPPHLTKRMLSHPPERQPRRG